MTAPIDNFIQLPLDTSNTGKKRRTQTRVVGANTVHEDYVVPVSRRNILGHYLYQSPVSVLPIAAQDGLTTGVMWIINPIGSGKKLALKRLITAVHFTASAIDTAVGFLRAERFTYTGTPSGTAISTRKLDSNYPTGASLGFSASTGMTISLVDPIYRIMLPIMHSATAVTGPVEANIREFAPLSETDECILNPGEGMVVYSNVALTTANRSAAVNAYFEEFE